MNALPDNPLLAPWTGPFGGVPPFDAVSVEHFEPAILHAIEEARAELRALGTSPEAPTFDNTLAALEDTGRTLDRVLTVYYVWSNTMSSPALREVEVRIEPLLAGWRDEVVQDPHLFARIDAVRHGAAFSSLSAEQQRLTERTHDRFRRHGAKLSDAGKERLSQINQTLAGHYTAFSQNLLADEETVVTLSDPAELAGLPTWLADALAATAADRQLDAPWAVANTRSSMEPFLTYSTRRDLREAVWRAYVDRGDGGGDHDNNGLIRQVLALRAERAELLGYATHAHWRLEDAMAKRPEAALALMEEMWTPAVARVHEEVADQQALVDAAGGDFRIAPWDYRHYQEKVRKQRFDLDENDLKPYLQIDRLREAMFWMAGRLYGLSFEEVADCPVPHPDVRVWSVLREGGEHVGLWYFDPFARTGKRSGAWMSAYRSQERFRGQTTPIVSNNANFVKGPKGQPTLISWGDVRTLFHEFGHALHGLLSDVQYPSLAGTSVARDYVEFPSQLHEHWMQEPELLQRFARHVETDAPIPTELIDKLRAAATFNQGFATTEFLASALMDMHLHLAGHTPIDPPAFERETLGALGMPEELVMRHRTPQFAHVFAGDGYSAGYYSYLWADAITADAADAFREAGSMYDPATAQRLVQHVLSAGNTVDPAEAYRAFRGRDVQLGALMRERGFSS